MSDAVSHAWTSSNHSHSFPSRIRLVLVMSSTVFSSSTTASATSSAPSSTDTSSSSNTTTTAGAATYYSAVALAIFVLLCVSVFSVRSIGRLSLSYHDAGVARELGSLTDCSLHLKSGPSQLRPPWGIGSSWWLLSGLPGCLLVLASRGSISVSQENDAVF